VSTLLAARFDLVAAVTDGRQAVHTARRLDPDVVLLDVTMPELNGFQAARELMGSGSRAKLIMLTTQQPDDFVAAAITSGAGGYVLKSRMLPDLESAIDHVIAGRLFVPSLTSLHAIAPAEDSGGHAVQFGIHDRTGLNEFSGLLAAALRRGDVAAIMATEETRAGVAGRMAASGCDVTQAEARGRFLSFDATQRVSQGVVDGRIDASRVAVFVDSLDRARVAAGAASVTIVGEPAFLLCRSGHFEAAIELEQVWHDLTRTRPFLTVCPCPMESFDAAADTELFHDICAQHSVVCHAHDA
jgi:CheY-like chemotaxis protein